MVIDIEIKSEVYRNICVSSKVKCSDISFFRNVNQIFVSTSSELMCSFLFFSPR